jgi:lipopolysaccharide transport system permease protein
LALDRAPQGSVSRVDRQGGVSTARTLSFSHSPVGGLVWTLIRTDFKTRYQPTIGGFLWALAKPFAMFVVLVSVFSFIFSRDPQYRLNLIIGLFLWDFFAEGTKVGLLSLHAKGYLLGKARFPFWIPVVTSVSNALITLGVFVVAIVLFLALSGRPPSPSAVGLFGYYLANYALIVTGFSLAASTLFLRYRDLNQVWEVVIQAGFFVAPVIYPLAILPERFHFPLYLWPPTPIIQFSREVLVQGMVPSAKAHALLALETAIILSIGILTFRRLAPRAAEYL